MYKVITSPTQEPITLSEVKRHLRIYDDGYNDTQLETITTRSASIGTVNGNSVDILGTTSTIFANVGNVSTGAKLNIAINHSDNNITFTLWDNFTEISTTGQYSKVYTGGKRYLKAIATITVDSITFGVNVQSLAGDPTDDAELLSMITQAREQGEEYCRRAFATQTIDYYLDNFPIANYIILPMSPIQSVTYMKVYDTEGNPTTQDNYLIDTDNTIGKIVLKYSQTWASGTFYPVNPIRIRYVAGYTTLPQKLKNIMLYHVGLLYKYRDVAIPDNDLKALWKAYDFYRISWFGGVY